jgi:iron complex transport system ATP-binding protein
MDTVVKVADAGFSYNKLDRVFEKIDFSLTEGEILSILGPNGCGKTTLLNCINGQFKLKTGTILIENKNITYMTPAEVGRKIGYVHQSHVPTFPYTVMEIVLMGRAPHLGVFSAPSKKDHKLAEEAIETLGIIHLKDRPYTGISGGEAQLVFMARALVAQPKVLLLDEPTSHLDLKNQMIILDVLCKLAKEKRIATIMSTHFPNHALSVSDKVLLMSRGKAAKVGSVEAVLTEGSLAQVFEMDIRLVKFKHKGNDVRTVVPIRHDFRINEKVTLK